MQRNRWISQGRCVGAAIVMALALNSQRAPVSAAASDIVLYAADVATLHGNWTRVSDSTAAGGQLLNSIDVGWSNTTAAAASPNDYVEATFNAPAATPYRLWLRLRAGIDSKYNDSVWVQFSDSNDTSGSAVDRIGTTGALLVNLATDTNGTSIHGWGWQNAAYWFSQTTAFTFTSSGTHTIRVQTREDGVQIDQIVLSPATYLSGPPGPVAYDNTIVSKSSTTTSSGGLTPYLGSPVLLPGTVQAENFDNGGEGVAYHDADAANNGGAYRQTGVDIEAASGGGYDVGWFGAGEWMNYTVNVATAGTYTVQLRVAAPNSGARLHVGFNKASSVWQSVSIPATGGWQNWTTASFTATLGAGVQQLTVQSDTGGVNVDSITVAGGAVAPPPPTSPPPPSGGITLPVAEWNIQINDSSEAHARLAMDQLLAQGPRPEVIVIVEAYQQWFPTYIDELQRQTGQTWYGAFATHCAPGNWNGSACTTAWYQGIGIFSSHPIANSSSTLFPYADCWTSARAGLRAAVNVSGVTVQVFATHLQTGGCTDDRTSRYNSLRDLKAWAGQFGGAQLAAGDFNADPDQIDTTQGMLPNFVDSWSLVGSGSRFTAFQPNPTMKIDYWFGDSGGRATPTESRVVTSTGSVSDHYPLLATFVVR